MPKYVIERYYLLPIYQRLIIDAPDITTAGQEAVEDDDWESAEEDGDGSGATTINAAREIPEGLLEKRRSGTATSAEALVDAAIAGLDQKLTLSVHAVLPVLGSSSNRARPRLPHTSACMWSSRLVTLPRRFSGACCASSASRHRSRAWADCCANAEARPKQYGLVVTIGGSDDQGSAP